MLYLMIALGGSAGALSRYFVSVFINNLASASFPLGTLFLNITGSFAIGFLFQVYQSVLVSDEVKNVSHSRISRLLYNLFNLFS